VATLIEHLNAHLQSQSPKRETGWAPEHMRKVRTQFLLKVSEFADGFATIDVGDIPEGTFDERQDDFAKRFKKAFMNEAYIDKLITECKTGKPPNPEFLGAVLASDIVLKSLMTLNQQILVLVMAIGSASTK